MSRLKAAGNTKQKKNCQKGYSCGHSCIQKGRGCKDNPLEKTKGQAAWLQKVQKNDGRISAPRFEMPKDINDMEARATAWCEERGFSIGPSSIWHDSNHQFIGKLYGADSDELQQQLGFKDRGPGTMEELLVNTYQNFILSPDLVRGKTAAEILESAQIDGESIRDTRSVFAARVTDSNEQEYFRNNTWEAEYVRRVDAMINHPQFEEAVEFSRQTHEEYRRRDRITQNEEAAQRIREDLLDMPADKRKQFLSGWNDAEIEAYRSLYGDDLYGNGKEEYQPFTPSPSATMRTVTGDDSLDDGDLDDLFGLLE